MRPGGSPTPTTEVGRGAAAGQYTTGVPRCPERISQPHFALPAVLAAAEPDPLKAALDAVWAAVCTYGEHYPELLKEIRAVCAGQAGSRRTIRPAVGGLRDLRRRAPRPWPRACPGGPAPRR
ncbi:hypothetical protein GCM10018793_43380 [Streptomyces sulfonofaciens]|uniref:Uncharacterized protein n=1 Tax=Streptomyces sulfonofaciens TaxID=68272 RepID=A0A919GDX8_9ACTN|nr:hypothetical protein GCM10018793_43380 [Streptomyces sulfonofaciens]